MRYRKLGETGLYVSEIGFGTIPILSGDVPVLPNYCSPDEQTAVKIMNRAFELGCNLFDTAIIPEYGDAEHKLGLFAAQAERSALVLSDKARYYDGNQMYEAVLRSCETLGTYADLYFVHQVEEENADIVFGKYGAVEALTQLKAEGRIRFAGVATHYYSILLRAALDERVDVVQGSGNILERGMLERMAAEPLFARKGILVNKVYAAGILPSFFPVETLIGGVLQYPVSSALIGIGSREEAEAALGMKAGTQIKENRDLLPTFEEVLSVLDRHYGTIPCDRCERCVCPYGTEIHVLFRQYHYYHLGKDYWALRKLDLGIRESAACCAGCTDMPCLKQCPRKIRIPEMIENICKMTEIHIRKSRI